MEAGGATCGTNCSSVSMDHTQALNKCVREKVCMNSWQIDTHQKHRKIHQEAVCGKLRIDTMI